MTDSNDAKDAKAPAMERKPPKSAAQLRDEFLASLYRERHEFLARRAAVLVQTVDVRLNDIRAALMELYAIAGSELLPEMAVDGEALAKRFEALARIAREFTPGER
jgi:hypothetical protein